MACLGSLTPPLGPKTGIKYYFIDIFREKVLNKFGYGEILSDHKLGSLPHPFSLNTHLYMASLRILRPLLGPNPGVLTPILWYFKGKNPK